MTHESAFGLNTNILETNLVNILLLIGLLFFAFADFIKTSLNDRQNKICERLDNAANRLILANYRYKDSLDVLKKLRQQALALQKNKIDELRKTRTSSLLQFESFIDEEVHAVKSLVLGRSKSFDRELITNIFSFYHKAGNDFQKEPSSLKENQSLKSEKTRFRKSAGQRQW